MNNWEQDKDNTLEQNLETQYGKLTLEKLHESDRGNFQFATMLKPGAHNNFFNLIPAYYFSEELAKQEIQSWLERLEQIGSHEPPLRIHLTAEYILHGKHCMLTTGKADFGIKDLSPYFFNVTVPRELQFILTVDYADSIPRIFVNEESAKSEAEAWVKVREQAADFSKWEKLA
ncbi:hypothetical protein G7B40_040380 [Aetokthonos hydrillicola Thurmond2011]|jgi:hypothetical protein|uniref:Uncharacterized protein n=1 Tax=Aetokthonos hydrillicola Thurmond2011 TaxID=2712845 RepID=A0AAP5IFF8_9CYAN|nr:hypothetical protein [Aetokthonos hydrillicola]MBO3463674.1 hypothetical protein [Aetokthonos hydrillicola CCALA 1050]MDR9900746.1 hypothetical protein [Aetokthonos hydrillicola Thurmond2011]